MAAPYHAPEWFYLISRLHLLTDITLSHLGIDAIEINHKPSYITYTNIVHVVPHGYYEPWSRIMSILCFANSEKTKNIQSELFILFLLFLDVRKALLILFI